MVFDQIKWQEVRNGALKSVRTGCKKLGLKMKLPLAETILFTLMRDEELRTESPSRLACICLALLRMN